VFEMLDRQDVGAGGEIQLTDAMARLISSGPSLHDSPFHGYRFAGERFDCGDKAGFIEATIAFGLRHPTLGGAVRDIVARYGRAGWTP
jgi:UTP--glucose-1-phosphate uridylyltransferase